MRVAISTIALLACTSLASAADFGGPSYDGSLKDGPVLAQQSWSGFYVGGNVGYGWADVNGDQIPKTAEFPNGLDPDTEPNGWFGGGQIGYNFQSGSVVFGLEADYQVADMDDSLAFEVGLWDGVGNVKSEITSFGTVRGRLGVAIGRVLPYVTGGFAWADVEFDTHVTYTPEPKDNWKASDSAVHTGWVIGGGIEVALDQNWSIKGEYLYFDLGEESYTTTYVNGEGAVGDTYKADADLTMQTVRLGVNYKFNH